MQISRHARRGLTVIVVAAGGLGVIPAAYATPSGLLHNSVRIRTHAGKCLDVNRASTRNEAPIIQYTCHRGANQRFKLRGVGNGIWEIRTHAGKCLDVKDASRNDWAPIVQYTCHGRPNQKFRIVDAGNGKVRIRTHAGKCLDVSRASTRNGARIIQYTCHRGANQRFTLDPVG